MDSKLLKYACACLSVALFGCNDEMNLRDDLSWDGGNIHAEVVQIKPFQENEIEKSLVYGSLVFEHIKPTGAKVNLTCITISIGDAKSESISVDSVVDYLTNGYTLDKGRTKVPVYWKMNKRLSTSGKDLKLFIREGCELAHAGK